MSEQKFYVENAYFYSGLRHVFIPFYYLFQVPTHGNYSFAIACDDECDLLMSRFTEEGIDYHPNKGKQLLAYTKKYTRPQQWNK